MTRADVAEFYRVRIPLEKLAVELIAEKESADLIGAEGYYPEIVAAAGMHDAAAFKNADLGFRRALWAAAGNGYLDSSLERLVPPLFAFTMARLGEYAPSGRALSEMAEWHGEILRLLRMRDKAGASAAMEASMDRTWVDGLDLPEG
jgi:DNA-binding GntR family transcriptional regulator